MSAQTYDVYKVQYRLGMFEGRTITKNQNGDWWGGVRTIQNVVPLRNGEGIRYDVHSSCVFGPCPWVWSQWIHVAPFHRLQMKDCLDGSHYRDLFLFVGRNMIAAASQS
jgi:hypothetical protein